MDFTYESNRISLYSQNQELLAEITFPSVDDDTVDINRTFVDGSLRGQGVAGKLMEAVVKELQLKNKKATLTCSYAVKWFEKHPEFKNLVK